VRQHGAKEETNLTSDLASLTISEGEEGKFEESHSIRKSQTKTSIQGHFLIFFPEEFENLC